MSKTPDPGRRGSKQSSWDLMINVFDCTESCISRMTMKFSSVCTLLLNIDMLHLFSLIRLVRSNRAGAWTLWLARLEISPASYPTSSDHLRNTNEIVMITTHHPDQYVPLRIVVIGTVWVYQVHAFAIIKDHRGRDTLSWRKIVRLSE